jgi:hypothetical protein
MLSGFLPGGTWAEHFHFFLFLMDGNVRGS